MATQHNFRIKNGLEIAGVQRISAAGVITGTLDSNTTATTQSASDNSTKIATTAYTDAAITAVIGGAPGTLDTLNELAAAINDDASYASTLTTALAGKLPLAGGTLTGNLKVDASFTVNGNVDTSASLGEVLQLSQTDSVGGFLWSVNRADGAYKTMSYHASNHKFYRDQTNLTLTLDSSSNATFTGTITTTGATVTGNSVIGNPTTHDSEARLQVAASDTSPDLSSATPASYSAYFTNSDGAYGTMFGSLGTGVGLIQQRRENDATMYGLSLQPYGGNVGIGGMPHSSGRLLVTNGGTNQIVLKGSSGSTNINMGSFSGGGYISNNYYYSGGHQNDDSSKGAFEIFLGDSSYAINYHSAGAMGTRRRDFHITDTGKVGMGTNNPQAKLHITGQGGSTSPTLTLASDTSTTFNHSINALNPYLAANENNLLVVGKAGSTKDAGYIGYKWKAAGSNSNIVTLGHWGHNNIVNIDGLGNTGFGTESPYHSKQRKSEITVTTAITSNAHSVNAGNNGGYDVSNDEGLVAWDGMKSITTGGHYNKPVVEMRIIGNMAANTWYPIATMSQLTNWCGDTGANEYNGFSMYFRIYTYDTAVGGGEYLGSRMSERIWINAYTCNSTQRQTLHVGAAWGHAPNNGQTAAGSGPYQLSIKHHYNNDSYYPALQTLEFLTTAAKTGLTGSSNSNITIYGHVG